MNNRASGLEPFRRAQSRRDGQALVEVMIGLIAILALVAGLVQVVSLARAQTETMNEARRRAGEASLLGAHALQAPDFIRDWFEGPDERRHTRDDSHNTVIAAGFSQMIVDRAAPDAAGWRRLSAVPADALPSLRGDPVPACRFGLVRGRYRREVALLPAVQSLLYRSPSIEIESEVWLSSVGGLY